MAMAAMLPVTVFGMTGAWRGELALGQTKLPLVFNFTERADGVTECTMDSPNQGAKGIPVTVALCSADSLSLSCVAIGVSYTGKIMPGEIRGTFMQRGYSFPLNLQPEAPVEERRPQTPKPPYPYTVVDTMFTAPDGAVMGATLTLPPVADITRVPAVVMVTGSGPQNRDEELFDHRPFAVIADCLARNGIASLRYDDRGTGDSGGNFLTATTDTLKNDAANALAFLRTIVPNGKAGVLGHSEGGTIAFMMAADGAPDFIISLAGLAILGKEALMRQNAHVLDLSGITGADKENALKIVDRVFDTMARQHRDGVYTPIDIDSLVAASGVEAPPQIMPSLKMTQKIRTPWIDGLVSLNPREYLVKITCPVLAINGDKDTQVEADNLEVIHSFVPNADTRLMPGLNHLMQHAVTGETAEYGEIRETVAPEVLDLIVNFIRQVK